MSPRKSVKVSVLLQHDDLDALAGEEEAEHHPLPVHPRRCNSQCPAWPTSANSGLDAPAGPGFAAALVLIRSCPARRATRADRTALRWARPGPRTSTLRARCVPTLRRGRRRRNIAAVRVP